MAKHVQVSQDGRVATIVLSNPPYNLVTRTMTEELDAALAKLEGDASVGSIVLVRARTGSHELTAQTSNTPGIFLSHYDVEEILELGDAPQLGPSGLKLALNVEWVRTRSTR